MSQALKLPVSIEAHPAAGIAPRGLTRATSVPVERDPLRLMRRKPGWMIPFVMAGMVLGGWGFGKFWTPTYRSRGLLQIAPSTPNLLGERQGNEGPVSLYEAYITSQVSLLTSQQVVQRAAENDAWKPFRHNQDIQDETRELSARLDVARIPGSELIAVAYTNRNPQAAQAGVAAVLDAYVGSLTEQDQENGQERLKALQQRRDQLGQQVEALQAKILAIGAQYGTDDLQQLYALQLQEVNRLQSLLRETQQARAQNAATPAPAAGADAVTAEGAATAGDADAPLLVFDPVLRQYMRDRAQLTQNVELLSRRFGENHRTLIEARTALASLDRTIQQYTDDLRKAGRSVIASNLAPVAGMPALTVVEDLRDREQRLASLHERALAETSQLGRRNLEAKQLRSQVDLLQQAINETDHHIDAVKLNQSHAPAISRVQILSRGDRPTCPLYSDPRMVMVLGAMVGAGIVCAVVIGLGAADPRLRTLDETRSVLGRTPVVGILPALPRNVAGSPRATAAARAVRQLSSWLQIWRGAGERRVLAITSPTSGDGKTSLSLALGTALAESGCRTLLVDCDMVGRGLTARIQERLARGSGGAGRDEADEPMRLTSAGDAEAAHAARPGLLDALRGEPLDQCVTSTQTPGLFAMLLSSPGSQGPESLSLMSLRRLVGRARKQFDIILIDTGPICASPEAPLVAEESDGVLLAVSRGDRSVLVRAALEQLASIEAPVVGAVYNRASRGENGAVGSAVNSGGSRRHDDVPPRDAEPRASDQRSSPRWPTSANERATEERTTVPAEAAEGAETTGPRSA